MRRVLTGGAIAMGVVGVVVALIVAAWAVDERARGDRVARDVRLAGHGVGGLDRAGLAPVVDRVAGEIARAPLRVNAPGGGFVIGAREIGLELDRARTIEATLGVGRHGSPVGRVARWVLSAVRPSRAPVKVTADVGAVYAAVAAHDPGPRVPAKEPNLRERAGRVSVVEGTPGRGIDPAHVVDALPEAVARGVPLRLSVERGPVAPRHGIEDARQLAAVATRLSPRPLQVTVGGRTQAVGVRVVRSWFTLDPRGTRLQLALDHGRVVRSLRAIFPDTVRPPRDARFNVVGGDVLIVPGNVGTECCSERAAEQVEDAVLGRRPSTGPLPLALVDPEFTVEEARALKIVAPIGSFTTNHPAGEPRVQNIHRIADIVRGALIRPGETFSLNKVAGPRTLDRGFVSAPVIEEGKFAEGVGGGVSQFATTLFNAAFFGGLDFVEYQSHSIYIGRYPYGREATLNIPAPDLKLRNPSKYGVLVWASYTEKSVSVTLFSTRFAIGRQTKQVKEPRGPCTFVRTERTRKFTADGTVKIDHVNALYRPEEGVDCPR